MKKINIISVLFLALIITSCAHRVKFLNVGGVSMTKYHLKNGQKTKELDEVEGKFCPDSFKQSGSFGLIDEAVKDAQKNSKADFLTNVTFYREGSCVVAVGTPLKIVK